MYHFLLSEYQPSYTAETADILLQQNEILREVGDLLHDHDYYEFFLVEEGQAIHPVNGQYSVVGRGTLAFIRPWDTHCFIRYRYGSYRMINVPVSCGIAESVFAYLGDITSPLRDAPMPPCVTLDETVLSPLITDLYALHDSAPSPLRGAQYRACLLRVLLILCSYDTAENRTPDTFPQWLHRLIAAMEAPDTVLSDLPAILASAGVSKEHLCRTFRRYLGVTPSAYTNSIRLRRAAALLADTDKTVLDIAIECGFSNLGYFYRCFGAQHGISPGDYRKQKQKQRASFTITERIKPI